VELLACAALSADLAGVRQHPAKSSPPEPVVATGAPSIALEISARLPSPAIHRSRS